MRLIDFEYTKEGGEKTSRKVLQLHSTKDFIDAIDLGKLNDEEVETAMRLQKQYEIAMKPLVDKAFRRFSKDKMSVQGESNE